VLLTEEPFPMLLRHATLRRNLSSINAHGLLCSKSQGPEQVVWLHSASASAWAVLHTALRHGDPGPGVVILEVAVPRSWLRLNRRKLWCCTKDIEPERFRGRIGFAALSVSPPPKTGQEKREWTRLKKTSGSRRRTPATRETAPAPPEGKTPVAKGRGRRKGKGE
jgi:hypothetical protein